MAIQIYIRNESKDDLIVGLSKYLPHSLPLVRRLQFMQNTGGSTPSSKILVSSNGELKELNKPFVAAYLDFSRGPETEMWLYSTIDDAESSQLDGVEGDLVKALFRMIGELEKEHSFRETPGVICVGSMSERVLEICQKMKLVKEVTEPYYKYIFMSEDLPNVSRTTLDSRYRWTVVRTHDIPLVLSRTSIPRKERTIKLLPSLAIANSSSTKPNDIICWGFLGPDASLTSLHCEEEHRGKGLAKALAAKLFREQALYYPETTSISHADVLTTNLQSQGLCKSLNGKILGKIYWVWIGLSI